MQSSEQIEESLGINLPAWYSELINNPSEYNIGGMLELYLRTDPEWLIENNKIYVANVNDISDIDNGTLIGSIKRLLQYGSKQRIIKHRKLYFDKWVKSERFMIGSDGGEEDYFIKLSDIDPLIYVLDLEAHESKLKFKSINEYIDYANSFENGSC
ncbi:MAG: hypothetical protein K1566_19100 [Candidatus Thiodiazotropha sp. (ex. Lucinisca nassula)]|nr:hypothetical protein [Candidatus Thiodiazotropha sp. (ex. Lucinisca nassula)]MCG7865830.1 hypothetical protein [Candidatus Thiodiazotropha taylori]